MRLTRLQTQKLRIALFVCLLGAVFYRSLLIDTKHTLDHDEAISLLAAACRQSDYANESQPFVTQSVGFWKRYLEPSELFCFGEIQRGLAIADIHPPLYFWLLHVWIAAIGLHASTGVILNVLIGALITAAVYTTARLLFRSTAIALLSMATYAFNPSALLVTNEARQYDLYALWTVLLLWALIFAARIHTSKRILPLSLTVLAGMLTHYQFTLLWSGLLIFLIGRYFLRRQRSDLWIITGLFSGALAALIVHPFFFSAFGRQLVRAPEATLTSLLARLETITVSLVSVYYLLFSLFLTLIIGLLMLWTHRKELQRVLQSVAPEMWLTLFLLGWYLGLAFAMYLAFLTPTHVLGLPKYLSPAWVLFAFVPGITLGLWQFRRSMALFLVLVPTVYGLLFPFLIQPSKGYQLAPELAEARVVLLDSRQRGDFFQVVWLLPDDAMLIPGNQPELLSHPEKWLPLPCTPILYVSDTDGPNSEAQQSQMLRLLDDQQYAILPVAGGIRSNSTRFGLFVLSKHDGTSECLPSR